MSDQTFTITNQHTYAIGVCKFDFTQAGYPDLLKVAQKWAAMPEFKQVILRKVSNDNWGIQFIYVTDSKKMNEKSLYNYLMKDLLKDLEPYASDVALGGNEGKKSHVILRHDAIQEKRD